ncbi:MAG: DUF2147 domain-containing protein [Hyphomicrobiales bacterium]|nr:MAG: DUF2147 domain-containing protein [Hyphomicrobiales bacterium]
MTNHMTLKNFSALAWALPALAAAWVILVALAPPSRAQPASSPLVGLWIDHTGRGAVEITPCGGSLCGHIAWLKDPNQPDGKPLVDAKGRPVCGLQIIGEVKQQSDGSWDNGWIYDPERDEQFSVELRLKAKDQLQVHGYLGIKLMGETYQWKRAQPNQARCKA